MSSISRIDLFFAIAIVIVVAIGKRVHPITNTMAITTTMKSFRTPMLFHIDLGRENMFTVAGVVFVFRGLWNWDLH